MPVVLELSKGSFGLCRTINAKQLAFFCCDPFQRTLSEIGKFAIYDQFLLLFRISRFTALSTIRTTVAILTTIPCYYSDRSVLPYMEGKIANMDVVHNDKMNFVVMAFDEGTGLSEHAAPGETLIFALDGEGVIGYEGKDHPIKAGENFHFAKAGLHSVKATKRFKMALLLTLE